MKDASSLRAGLSAATVCLRRKMRKRRSLGNNWEDLGGLWVRQKMTQFFERVSTLAIHPGPPRSRPRTGGHRVARARGRARTRLKPLIFLVLLADCQSARGRARGQGGGTRWRAIYNVCVCIPPFTFFVRDDGRACQGARTFFVFFSFFPCMPPFVVLPCECAQREARNAKRKRQ